MLLSICNMCCGLSAGLLIGNRVYKSNFALYLFMTSAGITVLTGGMVIGGALGV